MLLVMAGHGLLFFCKVGPRHSDGVGVAIFFALSGFLITALLLQERADTGRIDLPAFYLRRAARLFPALAVFLLAMGALMVSLREYTMTTPGELLATVFYVQNWRLVSGAEGWGLSHAWSLSVEEQFYLGWPLLLILLSRHGKRALYAAAIGGCAVSLAIRFSLWSSGHSFVRVHMGTDAVLENLFIGCLAAMILTQRRMGRTRPVAGALVLATTVLVGISVPPVWLPTVAGVGTSVCLVLVAQPGAAGVLGGRVLRWLGERSYALYLWHFPAFWTLGHLPLWIGAPIGFTVALSAAEASYRYVEQPVRQRARRWLAARDREREPVLARV